MKLLAGGGCLCAAWVCSAAAADIVYVPLNVQSPVVPDTWVGIDLAGDAAPELSIYLGTSGGGPDGGGGAIPGPYLRFEEGVQGWLLNFLWQYPARLAAGTEIGPGLAQPQGFAWWGGSSMLMSDWMDGQGGFVGFRMNGPDGDRYGWLRVQPIAAGQPAFVLVDAAYQTTPGAPIIAGQVPAPSACLLAPLALLARRRKRQG